MNTTVSEMTSPQLHIRLIAVQSIDGFITRHDAPGASSFASEHDQRRFRELLAESDCSVFGAATFRAEEAAINASLSPSRLKVVMTRSPEVFAAKIRPGLMEFSDESPSALALRLAASGHRRCSLLGGGQIYAAFLAAGLVDEICLTVEPWVFGGGAKLAVSACDARFSLVEVERLGPDTVFLRYAAFAG